MVIRDPSGPSIPGVTTPTGYNSLPQSSGTGLPSYKDLPTQATSSPIVPGTPEWYQDQLGGIYGAPIFIGITPGQILTGPQSEHGGGGKLQTESKSNYTNTERLYKSFLAMSHSNKNAYMQIQGQLYDAGFYGDSPRASVHWGLLDDSSRDAFKRALDNYVAASTGAEVPITWNEFLADQAKQGRINQSQGGVGGAGPGAAPPQVQLTDPAQIAAYATRAAEDMLGRAATPEEINKFVSSFQSQQREAQLSTASSATQPDLGAGAFAFIGQEDQGEASAHQARAYNNALLNKLLGPGASTLPNTNPTPGAV